jgi:hypothetical protein
VVVKKSKQGNNHYDFIHHHTGGLEMRFSGLSLLADIHHHTGGLEKQL